MSDRLEAIRTSELSHRERIEWLLSVVAAADELAAACADENAQWADIAAALADYRRIREEGAK